MNFVVPATNKLADVGWKHLPGHQWSCPCCENQGAFSPSVAIGGMRRHARCPHCGASERHRLALHAFQELIAPSFEGRNPHILHMAPEATAASWLRSMSTEYETADLFMPDVDHQVDIANMPFATGSFDLVWASHVLAVIEDDMKALAEVRRILRPGGVAVLPIPILGQTTVDYPEAVPGECNNWHGPGWDYELRFRAHFDRFEWFRSEDAPQSSQTFLYEDRTKWPSKTYPYRQASPGNRHSDAIPICWVD